MIVAIFLGIALRLWYVFHAPINSDTATVGIMARGILHAHFGAFVPGRDYGGAEAYPTAL